MANFLNIQKNEARGSEQIFLNDEKSYLVLQIRQTYTMKVKPKSRH